jgi:glutathione S-transferase
VDRWAEWSKVSVAINFTAPIFWAVVRTPKEQQNPHAIDNAVKALEVRLNIADDQLAKHRYLAGDDFTLADIQLGHILYRYFDIDIERKELPHLSFYYQRLCERPMYKKHVMVSYEALRA